MRHVARPGRRTAGLAALAVALQLSAAAAAYNPAPHTGGDNAGYIALAYSLVEHGA